jgi:hypothetical protein
MLGVKGLAESCEKGGLKCGQSKWKDEVDLDDDGQNISASNGWEWLGMVASRSHQLVTSVL